MVLTKLFWHLDQDRKMLCMKQLLITAMFIVLETAVR